jgi:T5orf172 domain
VLHSKSIDPQIAPHRKVLHKIGMTGSDLQQHIASVAMDATYLLADVGIVATYTLRNITRTKLENLLHRFFSAAPAGHGNQRPLPQSGKAVRMVSRTAACEEVVKRIKDETIVDYEYDFASASLVRRA